MIERSLVWLDDREVRAMVDAGTDAYRLADSQDVRIERFGAACLISTVGGRVPSEVVDQVLARATEGPALKAIYHRQLVSGPGLENAPVQIWGAPRAQHLFPAREAGLVYEVDFSLGYSCGLFLDQRANRERLRAMDLKRVLNLFCFTCSFSVCAAAAGACSTNIDLSKQTLTRGRRNFEVNGFDLSGHRFLADDVFDVLPRLARRGERYDVVILDPPTFSRGRRGRVFRAADDLPRLARLAADCLAPGGWLLLSTNCSTISESHLRGLARQSLPESAVMESLPPLVDFPAGTAAVTLWVRSLGGRGDRGNPEG
jgi:23S rRNA (cytosine1962-C5)-methyltransferase